MVPRAYKSAWGQGKRGGEGEEWRWVRTGVDNGLKVDSISSSSTTDIPFSIVALIYIPGSREIAVTKSKIHSGLGISSLCNKINVLLLR